MIELLSKCYIALTELLNLNFYFVDKVPVQISNQKLPKSMQIKICIMVIDVISLINTIRTVFVPFSCC